MMYDNRGKRKTSACCAPPGQNKAQRSFTKYVPLINIKAQRIGGKTRGGDPAGLTRLCPCHSLALLLHLSPFLFSLFCCADQYKLSCSPIFAATQPIRF